MSTEFYHLLSIFRDVVLHAFRHPVTIANFAYCFVYGKFI